MRRSCFVVAGCLATALLSLPGCGSDAITPDGPGNEQDVGQPPKPGPDKAGDGDGVVLAVDRLFLGETDRKGETVTAAWKQFGFNIDGKVSTTASTDLCKPDPDATPANVYNDGNNGIDNSFGKNLLGLIINVVANPSTSVSDSIAKGDFTVMLSLEGLGDETSYNPLNAKLYGGAKLPAAPAWDGTDKWPVLREVLNKPDDITSAKVVFPESYVVDDTWVSGTKGTFTLNLAISGNNIALTISSAIVSMKLSPDHKGAVDGTIAGVLETEGLVKELKEVIGALQPTFCEGTALEGILNQVRQASDIMKDGTQDPSQSCNAISIGLGFTATQVQLGDIAEAAVPGEAPCMAAPDGG